MPLYDIHLFGAAHFDRYGRCAETPLLERSNPGRFAIAPGGAAFNVACNLAALGARPRLSAIIGDDAEGRAVHAAAQARGVALTPQIAPQIPTASYTAIFAPDGALVIALADMEIYARFRPAAPMPGAALLVDANLPQNALESLLSHAAPLTAAMSVSVAKAGRLRAALARIDWLFANRAELATLCEAGEQADMDALARAFARLGGKGAVISDGPNNIHTLEKGRMASYPVAPTPIKDVTGAGDALCAGCLWGLMQGEPLAQAVTFGARAARAVLQVQGPWRADLAAMMKETP